jgi:hypothetical protein
MQPCSCEVRHTHRAERIKRGASCPLLQPVGIIEFHKCLKRPTIAPTFGVEQKTRHARILIPIIIGALNGAELQQSTLNPFRSLLNQAGRLGHLIFLAETPVISGWKEINFVVLSKASDLERIECMDSVDCQ